MDETNKPALYTPEQRNELLKAVENQMKGVNFGEIVKAALHTLSKTGVKEFFTNPGKVVAETMVTLAENNQLPAPPAPETKIIKLNPAKDNERA
jgi:hypothetical protein